jgi:hypothetical protein
LFLQTIEIQKTKEFKNLGFGKGLDTINLLSDNGEIQLFEMKDLHEHKELNICMENNLGYQSDIKKLLGKKEIDLFINKILSKKDNPDYILELIDSIKVHFSMIAACKTIDLTTVTAIHKPILFNIPAFQTNVIKEIVILDYINFSIRVFYKDSRIPRDYQPKHLHYMIPIDIIICSLIE